jgi:two-component system osmolarity sensor histidine kinase EnvZ
VFAWVQTLRALEVEPRALQAAQQTASLVNLSRAALREADGINRLWPCSSPWARSRRCTLHGPARAARPVGAFEVDRFTAA